MGPTWVQFGHTALILPIWDPFAHACWVFQGNELAHMFFFSDLYNYVMHLSSLYECICMYNFATPYQRLCHRYTCMYMTPMTLYRKHTINQMKRDFYRHSFTHRDRIYSTMYSDVLSFEGCSLLWAIYYELYSMFYIKIPCLSLTFIKQPY